MHLATLNEPPALPVFTPATDARASALWRVTVRPLGKPTPWAWQGWAHNSEDAKRAAVDDARQSWPGYSFAVLAVLQVNV